MFEGLLWTGWYLRGCQPKVNERATRTSPRTGFCGERDERERVPGLSVRGLQ